MDGQNPYAPPVETADVPPGPVAQLEGITLSERGWMTVTSLSKWMRIVSTFYFILGGLVAVGFLIALAGGGARGFGVLGGSAGLTALSVAIFGATALLLVLGAVWLRRAAFHFYDGVLSNAESALAQGFRNYRLYLILYGIFGILTLVKDVASLIVMGV